MANKLTRHFKIAEPQDFDWSRPEKPKKDPLRPRATDRFVGNALEWPPLVFVMVMTMLCCSFGFFVTVMLFLLAHLLESVVL